MKIYYANVNKIKKAISDAELSSYADIDYSNDKRFWEHSVGRYVIKTVAKSEYNINDTSVIINETGKPVFKAADSCFSVAHSNGIVVVCFDDAPCGIDIEYMKPRDLFKLSGYYKTEFKTLEEFYKFWTYKEASYKLGENVNSSYESVFIDDFMMCVVSVKDELLTPLITEIN